jgi:hypothetical protein
MVRGTKLKWIQAQGGWASAKLLLDTYGHFLPTETTGYADALSGDPRRPYTAPLVREPKGAALRRAKKPRWSPQLPGAPGRNRTPDPLLRRQPLSPLSYRGAEGGRVAAEPSRRGAGACGRPTLTPPLGAPGVALPRRVDTPPGPG